MQEVKLINYSKKEDTVNTITHLVGVPLGIVTLILCLHRSLASNSRWGIAGSIIYGISMILLYSGSSFYHGVRPGKLKKVLRVVDHCMVFLLISGSFTPYALIALRPEHPIWCWTLISIAWGATLLGITGTSISQEKFKVAQMILYMTIGWVVVIGIKPMLSVFSGRYRMGLTLLFVGGLLYTVGAILYGLGKKHPYFHAIFHGFVLAGSVVHFLSIYNYVLVMS